MLSSIVYHLLHLSLCIFLGPKTTIYQSQCFISIDCTFSQVTLIMRQDSVIRPVLDQIEDDEMFVKISELHSKSRLADLARPADLREVDLDIVGMQVYA